MINCVNFLGSPINLRKEQRKFNSLFYVDKQSLHLFSRPRFIIFFIFYFDVDFLLHVDQRLPEFFIVLFIFCLFTHHTIFLLDNSFFAFHFIFAIRDPNILHTKLQ